MKRLYQLTLLAATTLLAACAGRTAAIDDFNVSLYSPTYASGFEIVGAEGMKSTILRTKTPWQGADGKGTALLIARDGEKAPVGFDGQLIDAPAQRIVCMSSTHVAILDALDAVQTIVGVSGIDYVSNSYIADHRDQVADVGFDGNVNYEALVSLSPDLVLLFGVSGASGMEPKLRELGIPFAYVGEYLEESPLGKAEWLVALAETVGRREQGKRIFAAIPERYNALKAKTCAISNKPKVMINIPYGDSWFMASTGSYIARLIADAGGEYIYSKNTSNRSLPIGLEAAARLTSEADVWLNVGNCTTLDQLKGQLPKFADAACVRHGQVYNCDKRMSAAGGNDYWESGVIHPDLVLRDLIKIFHPETVEEDFVYYRRLE